MYGKPKGKDAHIENEGQEPKKGMSKTEIQAMMRKIVGHSDPQVDNTSPLLPNAGGKRGRPL